MTYIWELESCYVKNIVTKFERPIPPCTTVTSIVKSLERKKYVKTQRVGNTYLYTPAIKKSEYKRSFMSGIVKNYFENSYKEMVSFFVRDQKVSTNDPKEIIGMIKKRKES